LRIYIIALKDQSKQANLYHTT